jgi:hypothetical protein
MTGAVTQSVHKLFHRWVKSNRSKAMGVCLGSQNASVISLKLLGNQPRQRETKAKAKLLQSMFFKSLQKGQTEARGKAYYKAIGYCLALVACLAWVGE